MQEQQKSIDETAMNLAFWRREAETLKETAELCWSAERRALGQENPSGTPAQPRQLREADEALGVELELLYRYLTVLAIQYLAIGILIERDPMRFLQRPPQHRIVALVEECGVPLTAAQRHILAEVESAFAWGERYPVGPSRGNAVDSLAAIVGRGGGMAAITSVEKAALDALFDTLMALALEESAA